MVQRSDGTLWVGTTEVTTSTDAAFVATSFSQYYESSGTGGLTCAVQASDSTVWCWGANSYGQLGNGDTSGTASATPVQVVTSTGGPALANVASVYVDGIDGYNACAIDKSSNVWCWGYGNYGVIGNGYTYNEPYAVPVVTSSGGAQFTGVAQLSVSYDHVCAVTTAGSVWCWGDNNYGQIGVGNTTTAKYSYPTQVQALFNSGVNVSVGSNFTCATTSDGSVWCWGYNGNGVLGNGNTTGTADVPIQVQTVAGDGGAPFGGAASVQVNAYDSDIVCAVKSVGGAIWCWGDYYADGMYAYVPTPYQENGFAITGAFQLCANGASDPSFIDSSGAFHSDGSKSSSQNLMPLGGPP